MGPGLVCLLVFLIGGLLSLVRRVRGRHAALIDRLTKQAGDLFAKGRLREARKYAALAAARADERWAIPSARAHFCFGRILARLGDETEAVSQLQRAVALAGPEPHLRALAEAHMSLILRRMGLTEEALAHATEAAAFHGGKRSYAEPFMRAGAGWANVALALALTDARRDGRQAAQAALQAFEQAQAAEGVAYAHYAMGYALYAGHDPAAATHAQEAYRRYTMLYSRIPELYGDRLAETRTLVEASERRPSGR